MIFYKPTKQTSDRMRKIKSKGTKLEHAMKKILKNESILFEVHPKIFGNPDFRIRGTKILIFCDSSFWHGKRKNEINGKAFKHNKKFWVHKLLYNKKRDSKIRRSLRRQGWSVYGFWDIDIFKKNGKVSARLKRIINGQNPKQTNSY